MKIKSATQVALEYGTNWSGTGAFNFDCELDWLQVIELLRSNHLKTFLLYFPAVRVSKFSVNLIMCSGEKNVNV